MNSLQRLHQELFHREWNEALSERQSYPLELEKYEKRFVTELPHDVSISYSEIMYSTIQESSILLYGDFHTSRASVDGCRDILRKIYKTQDIILCLELFRASDQDLVDAYLANRISEFEFLEAIQYESDWGFPWKHYQELLKTARDLQLPVYGVDTHRRGFDQLHKRDAFMSQQIKDIQGNNPESLLVCVVGENHLALDHLPKNLHKLGVDLAKVTRVVNNVDQYFFRCLDKKTSFPICLTISDRYFCIMNSTPWSKWKSFNMWSDLRATLDNSDIKKTGEHNEIRIDLDYHFYELCRDLSSFLNLDISPDRLQMFSIDESSFQWLSGFRKSDTSLKSDYGLYDLEKYTVSFNEHWQDAFPYLAGQFLYHSSHPNFDFNGKKEFVFYKYVLWHAIGTICAKIFDPHFSVMTIRQHQKYIDFHANGLNHHHQQATSRSVVNIFRDLLQNDGRMCSVSIDVENQLEVAVILGQVLGSEFSKHYPLSSDRYFIIKKIFNTRLNDTNQVSKIIHEILVCVDINSAYEDKVA